MLALKGDISPKLKIFHLIFTDYQKSQAITAPEDCKPSSNYEGMCNPVNKPEINLVWKKKKKKKRLGGGFRYNFKLFTY